MADILSFFGASKQSNASKPKPKDKEKSSKQQKNSPKSKSNTKDSSKASLPFPLPKPKSQFEYIDRNKSQHTDNPPHAGEIEIPLGAPDCLKGINLAVAGTLNSITRQQLREIVSKYGGKLISKIPKVDIFIRGVKDVNREKLEEARDNNKTIIDEEGLFYILRKSLNPEDTQEKEKIVELKPEPTPPPPIKPKPKLNILSMPDSCPSPSSSQTDDKQYPASQPTSMSDIINFEKQPISTLFTEKYRPREFDDLVGNESGVKKLRAFLKNFQKSKEKSVLIYGPPGIGKTTSAIIAAKSERYHIIEFNASDTRNKQNIEKVAKDIFTNQTLFKYRNGVSSNLRSCLIFDEVDGMSDGDRGGLKALTDFIKISKIPIICICNDGDNKKLQQLKNCSIVIPFSPPTYIEMAQRLDKICKAENIKMNRGAFSTIINKSGGDIRSVLNSIQLWSSGVESSSEKDVQIKDVFQAISTLFKPKTEFEKRIECFFVDYNVMPAYVHQYCTINDKRRDKDRLHTWFEAIDSMAYGSEMENIIRSENTWDLLNPLAIVSSVYPATLCPKYDKIFPTSIEDYWRASKQNANFSNLKDISMRCRRNCEAATASAFRDSTADLIVMKFECLLQNNQDAEAVEMLDQLELTKDDVPNLQNITSCFTGFSDSNPKMQITDKTNKRFTQLYKQSHPEMKKSYNNFEDERSDYYIKSFPKNKFKRK